MRLTDRQWELVELVGGMGYSYKRAALHMGITYATVREYAAEIRTRARLSMDPQRALIHIWYQRNVDRSSS